MNYVFISYRESLNLGHSVIFTVQSTGEAELSRAREEEKSKAGSIKKRLNKNGFMSLAKDSWMYFLKQSISDSKFA